MKKFTVAELEDILDGPPCTIRIKPDGSLTVSPLHRENNMDKDNWKHRSDSMMCKTCMWYAEKVPAKVEGSIRTDVAELPEKSIGRCRKHAPTMNGYPAVFWTDWCGDHKLDENKI